MGDPEINKFPELLKEAKKKSAESDIYRKEAFTLKIANKGLESDLTLAKRKIIVLQNDLNLIHQELTNFSETFEVKLEASTKDRENLIEEKTRKIELLSLELHHSKTQLASKIKVLKKSKDVFQKLASQLLHFRVLVDDISTRAHLELKRKTALIESQTSTQLMLSELSNEIAMQVSDEYFQDTDKLKKDNMHLSKELAETRKEMGAFKSLEIDSELVLVAKKEYEVKQTLFTQGTLMLDYSKLFEKSETGYEAIDD